jgi:hypothetical protein
MRSSAEDSIQEHRRQGGPQSLPAARAQPRVIGVFAFDQATHLFEETIDMLLNQRTAERGHALQRSVGAPR